ncbi:MAG: hypothetical protein P8Y80_08515 [Acidobacteriota bacterium]|jgi:hypothetical protein
MKELFNTKSLLILTLFVSVFALSPVMATTSYPGYGVQAEIPFAFNAGDTLLPAGSYRIIRSSNIEPSIEVFNEDGSVGVFLLVEDSFDTKEPETSELVFKKIGGKDFLKEVHTESTDYELETSHQEQQLETQGIKSEIYKIAGVKVKK